MNPLIKRSLLNALGTAVYIALVAAFMTNAERFLGNKPDTIFAPILALTLFVLSASITGGLVVGKPLLMYLGNEKTEAVKMFLYTVGWLAAITVLLIVANVVV